MVPSFALNSSTMSYSGVLTGKNGSVIAPVEDMDIVNNSIFGRTGVPGIQKDQKIWIFPNPSDDHVEIFSEVMVKEISIFDLSGVAFFEKSHVNQNKIFIDLKNVPAGLYFIAITTDEFYSVRNLIKE